MKLYIVKYCANEVDDLGYDSPYPIYYSLDQKKARDFFEDKKEISIKSFNEFIKEHPEFENNEDYQIYKNETDYLEYGIGKWYYEYQYEEQELDIDLRYKDLYNK